MYANNDEFNKEEFILLLRGLMEDKSIVAFGEMVNIPARTINAWLLKRSAPSIDHLIRLSKHFDCSIDYLVGLKDY
ncbi:MAG: helix-turn-helix domain-containing protein [Firmicutes bacterium]|nr:helix-turn-helix domain-containing protein [Bacillota bacterium]